MIDGGASRFARAFAVGLALTCTIPGAARAEDPFRPVRPGVQLRFPADHASHPAYRTEWWYTTGHLRAVGAAGGGDEAGGMDRGGMDRGGMDRGGMDTSGAGEYGFQLTFFRSGVARPDPPRRSAWALRDLTLAHLAVTDQATGRFLVAERMARDAPGLAGADTSRYRVWIEDWEAGLEPEGTFRLTAREPGSHGLDLRLRPLKPPALHGEDGLSRKGDGAGEASYYYSMTRLAAEGTLVLGEQAFEVRGEAWMDHEFTTGSLAPGLAGWDWFGLQLDDRTELMVYLLRRTDGTPAPASSGSLVDASGGVTHLARDDLAVEVLRTWTSPATGAVYPAAWRISVSSAALELTVEPRLAAQELITERSTGITYWEGAVRVRGARAGRPLAGRGYVELTGYAEPFRARL